jgi:hypothetical protein
MTNTPETDNLARGNHVVPTEFAQDLERQLRKARDTVLGLRKHRAWLQKLVTRHLSPATSP